MKKKLVPVIAGLAAAIALAGCGKSETSTVQTPAAATPAEGSAAPAAKQQLTIWWAQWAPADGLQELGNEFEKETGVAVKVHQIPWPKYQDQVFLEFGNRETEFDVVVGDSQWLGRCATEGLYVNLTDWLPTVTDIKTIHPIARKYLCEYPPGSGAYYAAPCETDAMGVAYRKDWFEDEKERAAFKAKYNRELAPPDTWAEFRDVAEFFTRPDEKRYGCVLLTGRGYDALVMGFQQFLWGFGGSWGDAKTHKVDGYVNSPEAVAALTFMKDLLAFAPEGGGNVDFDRILESYKDTKSAAMLTTYFAFFPALEGSDLKDGTGYFVTPRGDKGRMASLGGQGLSISAKTSADQQALAKKFIAWFLQREVQEQWITKPAGFTANTEILASDAFRQATGYNAAFADSLDDLRDFWNVPQYNELLSIAVRYLAEALDGDKTPKEALDKIAAEHEEVFRDAGIL